MEKIIVGKKISLSNISKDFWFKYAIYFASIIFIIIMSLTNERFFTTTNIVNIFTQLSVLMILSIGMTLTLITKGIDMSVGSVMFLSAAVMQYFGSDLELNIPIMCLAGIFTGTIIGVVNGIIAAKLNVYPLLTTLATMYACRGLGLVITGGGAALMPIAWGNLTSTKLLGIPLQVYIAISLAIIVQIFLIKTKFGRHIFAVGDNQKAAHEKGINIFSVKLFAYTASGFMCGVASIISSSQVMSVPPNLGTGQEFYAIIAAVLGGASLFGGKGTTFPGCLIGALIMSTISNSLVLTKASPNMYSVIYACVIFVVVLLDTLKNKSTKMI